MHAQPAEAKRHYILFDLLGAEAAVNLSTDSGWSVKPD
jgi:hypothetical protein